MTPLETTIKLLMEKVLLAENKIAMLEADKQQHDRDIAILQRQIIGLPV